MGCFCSGCLGGQGNTTPKVVRHRHCQRKNRSSRVQGPFHFSGATAEEQLQEVAANPLLQRMNQSRRDCVDRYRPIYHYVNPEGMLNDPNGLCFWQGRWHLFYQAYPPEDRRQHWGHCVSDDLLHWQDLPLALYPDPEECCFSGTCLVEADRVIAMYHGTKVGNMVAISSDPLLLNWQKVDPGPGTNGAVIPLPAERLSPDTPYQIFDPAIWKHDGTYYSLSGGRLPDGPAGKGVRADWLFSSKDLMQWSYLHNFIEDDRYGLIGDDGACPYFWPIGPSGRGQKHILCHFSHMSGGKYILGDYDTQRQKFMATAGGNFNFGAAAPSGVHAPSACPHPDDPSRVVCIFNMNPGIGGERGWDQIMSLPRMLSLPNEEFNQLYQEPCDNVKSLRVSHRSVAAMTLTANEECVLAGISGDAMEIACEIKMHSLAIVQLCVLRSPSAEEFTKITFYKQSGMPRHDLDHFRSRDSVIVLDGTHASTRDDVLMRPPEVAPVYLMPEESLRLRVFVDKSIVEVFVNGKQCLAMRVYPAREDSVGVSLLAPGRDAQLISLDAWQMRNIYNSTSSTDAWQMS